MALRDRLEPAAPAYEVGLGADFALDDPPLRIRSFVDWCRDRLGIPDDKRTVRLSAIDWRPGRPLFKGRLDGRAFTVTVEMAAEGFTIRHRAATVRVESDAVKELLAKLAPVEQRLSHALVKGIDTYIDTDTEEARAKLGRPLATSPVRAVTASR